MSLLTLFYASMHMYLFYDFLCLQFSSQFDIFLEIDISVYIFYEYFFSICLFLIDALFIYSFIYLFLHVFIYLITDLFMHT